MNVAEGRSGRSVKKNAIEGVADAAAHGGQPLTLGLATNGGLHDRGDGTASRTGTAVKVSPVVPPIRKPDVGKLPVVPIGPSDQLLLPVPKPPLIPR